MWKFILTIILIVLISLCVFPGGLVLPRITCTDVPKISVWSLLKNDTLEKDYTSYNDELNITFKSLNFSIKYKIYFLPENKEQPFFYENKTNSTFYSIYLGFNTSGELYIEAKSDCEKRRIIEILSPSQVETANMRTTVQETTTNLTDEIGKLRTELETERSERKGESWKSDLAISISFIVGFITIIDVLHRHYISYKKKQKEEKFIKRFIK